MYTRNNLPERGLSLEGDNPLEGKIHLTPGGGALGYLGGRIRSLSKLKNTPKALNSGQKSTLILINTLKIRKLENLRRRNVNPDNINNVTSNIVNYFYSHFIARVSQILARSFREP